MMPATRATNAKSTCALPLCRDKMAVAASSGNNRITMKRSRWIIGSGIFIKWSATECRAEGDYLPTRQSCDRIRANAKRKLFKEDAEEMMLLVSIKLAVK